MGEIKSLEEARKPLEGLNWHPLESCPHDSLK
jgi:hypothetical protein